MIYNDILSNIKTVDQANQLASEIDMLLDALFKTEDKAFEKALNSISDVHSQMLREALLKNNINSNNLSMTKEYLDGLKEEIKKLKGIKLSLAFEPSHDSIDNLFAWVIQNLGSAIVLDIAVDKRILGGTIIEFEGKYKNLSLRKTLEEVFEEKEKEIMGYLKAD